MDSVYTFTEDNCTDFLYELNDSQLLNDILVIVNIAEVLGPPDVPAWEQLTRGHSPSAILKYGPRSRRLDRPILQANQTAIDLVTAQLDYYVNPVAQIKVVQSSMDDATIQNLLAIQMGDMVTVVSSNMGGTWTCFVQGLDLDGTENGVLVGTFDLIEARASELN